MKTIPKILAVTVLSTIHAIAGDPVPQNPAIDFTGFLEDAAAVKAQRENRRLPESEFMKMASEPGTVVLDARSADKFAMLHVAGAKNLPLPDFSAEALAEIIPAKTTRILIYCNNNFFGDQIAMVSKAAPASLNIYTFTSLHSYGYENVYELAPLKDLAKSPLKFEGSRAEQILKGGSSAEQPLSQLFGARAFRVMKN